MGWFAQGFLRKYDYLVSPKNYLKSSWVTGNNTAENPEINKFDDYEINFDDSNWEIEILYGPSQLEFFRGYLTSKNNLPKDIKSILKKFKNLPVYKSKHGLEKKIFKPEKLILIEYPQIILFYEIRKEWTAPEWAKLLDEFENMLEKANPNQETKALLMGLKPQYW